mgnify:CR=1 FL=1
MDVKRTSRMRCHSGHESTSPFQAVLEWRAGRNHRSDAGCGTSCAQTGISYSSGTSFWLCCDLVFSPPSELVALCQDVGCVTGRQNVISRLNRPSESNKESAVKDLRCGHSFIDDFRPLQRSIIHPGGCQAPVCNRTPEVCCHGARWRIDKCSQCHFVKSVTGLGPVD